MPGYDKPLPLFTVTHGGRQRRASWRRCAASASWPRWSIRPSPSEQFRVPIDKRVPVREFALATENYTEPLERFAFLRFLANSVFVTVVATLITLLINSMAAFALSNYEFRGKNAAMLMVIGTLMMPLSIILVPLYLVVTELGLVNTLWGVILPAVATPTGVFLLRQYMLTIPDELIDAARMDKASEWQIYWRIVLPLTAAGARGARDLLGHVALERLPVAAGRADARRSSTRCRSASTPSRASSTPVALPACDDGHDADPGRARLRLPAALHHHRHRQYRDEITAWLNHG